MVREEVARVRAPVQARRGADDRRAQAAAPAHRLRRARRRAAARRRRRRADLPRRLERDGDARTRSSSPIASRRSGLRKELTAAVARHNALWDGAPPRRRPRGPSRDPQPHRRHRTRGAAQGADQRRSLARWSTRPTAGSSSAPGIRERHILDPSLAASDLATEAGAEGVPRGRRRSGRRRLHHRRDGDAATARSRRRRRSCRRSWARRPGGCAFDLSAACAGFLYGLSIADAFIRTGQFKNVLVIGVEVLSRIVDWTDRSDLRAVRRRRRRRADDGRRGRRARHAVDAPVRRRLADRDPAGSPRAAAASR